MDIIKEELKSVGLKAKIIEDGVEVARGFIFLIQNDLHEEPYALLEDIFVVEEYRSKGLGKKIVNKLIEIAKAKGCYKLIATSRFERENVHFLYEKLGFEKHGYEFRLNLN